MTYHKCGHGQHMAGSLAPDSPPLSQHTRAKLPSPSPTARLDSPKKSAATLRRRFNQAELILPRDSSKVPRGLVCAGLTRSSSLHSHDRQTRLVRSTFPPPATMATQQILFAETIAGMKKAFKRKAYESDSDSEIESYSNRGHKLKKRARFAHKGQLVPTDGPSSYKEYVNYGGVQRAIIHRNTPLLDDEGYEIDSDDDDDRLRDAEAAAAELHPYANIHLEQLLGPLTSSTGLATHPTLSKPFTSETLTKLVDQSYDIMRKENRSLWQVRRLLTALCGDFTWVPCEMMVRPSDIELYTDDHVARHLLSLSQARVASNGDLPSPMAENGHINHEDGSEPGGNLAGTGLNEHEKSTAAVADGDISMVDADQERPGPQNDDSSEVRNAHKDVVDSSVKVTPEDGEAIPKIDHRVGAEDEPRDGEDSSLNPKSGQKKSTAKKTPDLVRDTGNQLTGEAQRAQELIERTVGPPSAALEALDPTYVHPMFIAPVGTKPDRDVGLPEQEAEDIRRLLALYVQKQEEVCRGAKKLFLGLLKADQLRARVMEWSKAEAHSGPNRDMSDGEDWFDRDEWGLTEDLKKGQDEEEEDTQTTGKKTRTRR
ncbi:hypothetical protein G7046_g9593 [Stylonectria norvegica]|nr:hypothetical protein G7046_g9593 [Stylonectria norvegica]